MHRATDNGGEVAMRSTLVHAVFWGVLITLAAIGFSTWYMWSSYRALADHSARDLGLEVLVGQIFHLDEVLSMSARMAVFTGDVSWEQRYRDVEPVLAAAIAEAKRQAPDVYVASSTAQVQTANAALIAMEERAFSLLRQGRTAEARDILFSADYEHHKGVYSKGIELANQAMRERIRERGARVQSDLVLTGTIFGLVLLLLIAGWGLMLRWVRKAWLERVCAQQALYKANQGLAQRTEELEHKHRALQRAIADRERIEEAQQSLQDQLVEVTQASGMAEVATSVLHNVGNVLTSTNVSVDALREQLRRSKVTWLVKATDMLRTQPDPGRFLSQDEKGIMLLQYLLRIADELVNERNDHFAELDRIRERLDHIRAVIGSQQSYASSGGAIEPISLPDLVSDALAMNDGRFSRHQVEIVRLFDEVPPAMVDRHKMLQVLVNLFKNAIEAMDENDGIPSRLLIRLQRGEADSLCLEITDNGIGIAQEHSDKIFTRGFTTKKNGHGFGLHDCFSQMEAMQGHISCHSNGVGTGATFRILVPVAAEAVWAADEACAADRAVAAGHASEAAVSVSARAWPER